MKILKLSNPLADPEIINIHHSFLFFVEKITPAIEYYNEIYDFHGKMI